MKRKTLLPFIALEMAFIKSFIDFIFTLPQFKIALLQVGEKEGKEKVSKNREKSMIFAHQGVLRDLRGKKWM